MGTTQDGKPCGAYPLVGSDYCFNHDPSAREAKREACRRGAATVHRRTALALGSKVMQLECAEDVRELISDTVHRLRTGELDRATANGVVYACQVALKAIDTRDLQRRITDLEAQLTDLLKGRK